MTGLKSSAAFRSNIYPTTTNEPLVNDRRFLDAISDPEALDILWRYNGSQGSKLNKLQKRQHEMAVHCIYAEDGDLPWGTPVGGGRVVCLCSRVDCPRYRIECSRFHPEGFVPEVDPEASVSTPEAKKNDAVKARPAVVTRPAQRTRPKGNTTMANCAPKPTTTSARQAKPSETQRPGFSFVSVSAVEQRSRQVSSLRKAKSQLGPWTMREDAILHEMYPIYGISVRKWTKRLPGRSVEEILDRAHELKVRYVPQRERDVSKARTKPKLLKLGDDTARTEKKRHREQMRRRPWEPNEDAILRKNYPIYGAEMKDWTQKLKYRTKESIEKRARQLGLHWRIP